MKKVIICFTGCFLITLGSLQAQEGPATNPAGQSRDTVGQAQDGSVISRDTTAQAHDTAVLQVTDTTRLKDSMTWRPPAELGATDSAASTTVNTAAAGTTAKDNSPAKDTARTPADTAAEEKSHRTLDTRWFISPLLKVQFQDFAFLEKNRKGYLSDANTLPFFQRGNASFAASAYKNLTNRLSISGDIGLSFGHVTNDNVLISQTKSKTYNLLNAAIYYHLLAPSYRLQPYITVGINDIINDGSYASAPIGLGAKFNAKKIMVMGQITYGYAVSKNVSNTTMYSVGVYLPIKNKKQKKMEEEDNSPYNRPGKDKKDTANKNNGSVVNNIYITINMDSVLKAKGLLDENGHPIAGRDGRDGRDGLDGEGYNGFAGSNRRRGGKRSFMKDLDDIDINEYKEDSIDGKPVVRFVVYFEFNEYGLNSHAFNAIDKVIGHIRKNPGLSVEIKGYTDSIGTNQYNNILSRKRAKMVLDYMNSRGVPTEFMKAKAYGSDDPVANNSDPNQAWLNRRAEIIVHEK